MGKFKNTILLILILSVLLGTITIYIFYDKSNFYFDCSSYGKLLDGSVAATEIEDGGTIIVFAHQDDDLLWMMPFFDYANKILFSATPYSDSPDTDNDHWGVITQLPKNYRMKWKNIWGSVQDLNFYWKFWYNADGKNRRDEIITVENIKDRLNDYISDKKVKRIVTHNNWGEYGHTHHIIVNKAVRELAEVYGKDVWVLNVKVTNNRYENLNAFGLDYVFGEFNHCCFIKIREIYQENHLEGARENWDFWTWHDGEYDYPYGKRMYTKIVDHGIDLTKNNAIFQKIEASFK